MKKRMMSLVIGASLFSLGLFQQPAHAAKGVTILIDGEEQSYDQPPILINGRTFVPLRGIFEKLGASVDWNGSSQTVTSTKGNTKISFQIGSNTANKDGETLPLDVPAQIINNRTMVPLRFVTEALGDQVEWDSNTQTVKIVTISDHELTPEEIGKFQNRVVFVETFDNSGNPLASGSGIVVNVGSVPTILTNFHVIKGASSAKVAFSDNRSFTTSMVLIADQTKDLALLDNPYLNLPVANLGDSSKVQLGQSVVAIGSPLGLQNTLSTGVISSISRTISGQNYIQISAPIDHGSSGGALFNMRGEVIGVTSAGISSNADLNLAIPSNTVKDFLQEAETPKKMSELPQSYEPAEIQQYLNENYGSLTTSNGHVFHFNYNIERADDGKSLNVDAVMQDANEYVDLTQIEPSDPTDLSNFMLNILQDMHNKGQVNPLVLLLTDFHVSKIPSGAPASEFIQDPNGGYSFIHPIANALLDDSTGYVKSIIEPDFNSNYSVYKMF